jgi:hypothetical protein
MTAMEPDMQYTVALQDFPEIPADVRQQAERRYIKTLEKALGGAEEVGLAYRAWTNAEDSSEDQLSPTDKSLAIRWQKAAMKAQSEGFNGLGEAPEAYFEVRLVR